MQPFLVLKPWGRGRKKDENSKWEGLLVFSVALQSSVIRQFSGVPSSVLFKYEYFHVQFQLESGTVELCELSERTHRIRLCFSNLLKVWVRVEFAQNYSQVLKINSTPPHQGSSLKVTVFPHPTAACPASLAVPSLLSSFL